MQLPFKPVYVHYLNIGKNWQWIIKMQAHTFTQQGCVNLGAQNAYDSIHSLYMHVIVWCEIHFLIVICTLKTEWIIHICNYNYSLVFKLCNDFYVEILA